MDLRYSFIIPVYNRPNETRELLLSLEEMHGDIDFEVVIVEDGSTISSKEVVEQFNGTLDISYFYKENSGPGSSRNYGMSRAKGNYFIIFDSDCIVPIDYIKTVDSFLKTKFYHCYGGADTAHESFSDLQKAINYSMTSFLTTGGIRGSATSVQKFEPRSFNMGISKEAFESTGGFGNIHPGEDPDLSQRLLKKGYSTTYLPNAKVYHKRRISWSKFYTQVKKFGLVRPILSKWHPSSRKITFWFPAVFTLFVITSLALSLFYNWLVSLPLLGYTFLIFIDSAYKNKSSYIGILSVIATYIQFFGYGFAFLKSTILINFLNRNPESQFPKLFFKN